MIDAKLIDAKLIEREYNYIVNIAKSYDFTQLEKEKCEKEILENIDDAIIFAESWMPPIIEEYRTIIPDAFTREGDEIGTALVRKYVEYLRPYIKILGLSNDENKPREWDCMASGIVFFYGSICFIMNFPGWGDHIEDIFLCNLLYLLVDHYLDDNNIDNETMKKSIIQMLILVDNPLAYKSMDLMDPLFETIAIIYNKLITNCPATKKSVTNLLKAEIKSVKIQKCSNHSREEYYDIAMEKGGKTLMILQDIVGNTDPTIADASYHIGAVMQLIDDSADVLSDKDNNIYTIATYDLEKYGNLDILWLDIMNGIKNIDNRFTSFIMIYVLLAIYLPDRFSENYSENIKIRTNPINLFDYSYGFDGSKLLVEAVMKEISIVMALDDK